MSKLPYPNTDTVDIIINLTGGGMDENGAPEFFEPIVTKCTLNESSLFIRDSDGKLIRLESKVYIRGDIAPGVLHLDGNVEVYGREFNIYRASRPRNPDGSVHHTKLELI